MNRLFALLAVMAVPASVAASPFDKGDPNTGKALYEKHCAACHVAKFGGDGSKVYTRADRKMKSADQLAKRISMCNRNTGGQLFPEDELHVGAYLNGQFYKFK